VVGNKSLSSSSIWLRTDLERKKTLFQKQQQQQLLYKIYKTLSCSFFLSFSHTYTAQNTLHIQNESILSKYKTNTKSWKWSETIFINIYLCMSTPLPSFSLSQSRLKIHTLYSKKKKKAAKISFEKRKRKKNVTVV